MECLSFFGGCHFWKGFLKFRLCRLKLILEPQGLKPLPLLLMGMSHVTGTRKMHGNRISTSNFEWHLLGVAWCAHPAFDIFDWFCLKYIFDDFAAATFLELTNFSNFFQKVFGKNKLQHLRLRPFLFRKCRERSLPWHCDFGHHFSLSRSWKNPFSADQPYGESWSPSSTRPPGGSFVKTRAKKKRENTRVQSPWILVLRSFINGWRWGTQLWRTKKWWGWIKEKLTWNI